MLLDSNSWDWFIGRAAFASLPKNDKENLFYSDRLVSKAKICKTYML